ncbi:MAG: arginine decarboxylase, pyruvoyl-dependent [bacterium]|nr:MAG: arginine decarboxylase, pyruvoyl-dependent [bacterium]
MIFRCPDAYFFVQGTSEGYMPLNAFDGALLASGIGNTNLVKMSSIVPPGAVRIEPVPIPYGALVPVAYASINSNIKGQTISAAVAAAFPSDPSMPGLIMEYSATGPSGEIENICRDMAVHGLMMRGLDVGRVESTSVSHQVNSVGAAFAAVVLWTKEAGT